MEHFRDEFDQLCNGVNQSGAAAKHLWADCVRIWGTSGLVSIKFRVVSTTSIHAPSRRMNRWMAQPRRTSSSGWHRPSCFGLGEHTATPSYTTVEVSTRKLGQLVSLAPCATRLELLTVPGLPREAIPKLEGRSCPDALAVSVCVCVEKAKEERPWRTQTDETGARWSGETLRMTFAPSHQTNAGGTADSNARLSGDAP